MDKRTRDLKNERENSITRNFLDITRRRSSKKLNEDKSYNQPSPEQTVDEQNDFKGAVDQLVSFEDIKILDDDVMWGGYLERFQIRFSMSAANPDGLTISANVAELDEEVLDVLKKLVDYYETWSNKWNQEISV